MKRLKQKKLSCPLEDFWIYTIPISISVKIHRDCKTLQRKRYNRKFSRSIYNKIVACLPNILLRFSFSRSQKIFMCDKSLFLISLKFSIEYNWDSWESGKFHTIKNRPRTHKTSKQFKMWPWTWHNIYFSNIRALITSPEKLEEQSGQHNRNDRHQAIANGKILGGHESDARYISVTILISSAF